jgi:WS/DGAT/MGAT family acyltransferase
VITGLADGRFALLLKFHHAAIDGAAGNEMLSILFDPAPSQLPNPVRSATTRKVAPIPTPAAVLVRAMADLARKPLKLVNLQLQGLRSLGEHAGGNRSQILTGLAPKAASGSRSDRTDRPVVSAQPSLGAAPRTPFNRPITAHRSVAFRTTSLVTIKATKNALGATVNDVLMASCAGGLRQYLLDHDALPSQPLLAMVPVSTRTGEEQNRWSNRVSALVVPLPTDVADPADRVAKVHEDLETAKERFATTSTHDLTGYADFAPPALATAVIRMASQIRITDHVNPMVNLTVANVPGPRERLFLGEAELVHYYPISAVTDGMGLNITLFSYRDQLGLNLIACRELVPDLGHLADLLVDQLTVLAKVAGVSATAP